MPARLSRLFGSSSKEKEALAAAEETRQPEAQPAPPVYQATEENIDIDNAINPPDLTAGFSKLTIDYPITDLPPTTACIAHLKLLEAFYRLKQSVGSTDGLFGIEDKIVHDLALNDADSAELLARLAEKRWAVYVARAVDRFETWRNACSPATHIVTYDELYSAGAKGNLWKNEYVEDALRKSGTQALQVTDATMPPLDVLLVWHAYMLNPRAFFEDCIRHGRMPLWRHGFPLEAVANAINSETFSLTGTEDARSAFFNLTGRDWDNIKDATNKYWLCPSCQRRNDSDWTEPQPWRVSAKTQHDAGREIDDMLSSGTGYCDSKFLATCSQCKLEVDHDYLSVGKFRRDLKALKSHRIPMPGTVFGAKGLPGVVGGHKEYDWAAIVGTTNKMFGSGIMKDMEVFGGYTSAHPSMTNVRDRLEIILKDRERLRELRGVGTPRMTRAERITIRRMMSRYWNNSSVFALDLVGAVIRQGQFTEKMHNIDWLHAPSLPYTMQRLLTKYTRFVGIMANQGHMAVPTLDVDLAWHTHQLMPSRYFCYTINKTTQFVDHDDKVSELKLNEAFAWTSKTYQRLYREPYSECTCWYCEAVRESTSSPASRLFHSSNQRANEMVHDVDQDPRKSVHISSHNAVRPNDDSSYDRKAKLHAQALEHAYTAACGRAKSKGRKVPDRKDYYYSDAYGYPVYIPAYAPYYGAMPYTPCYYPVGPGCMAVGAGSAGNCCAGTCSAAVSSGGCGGSGGAGGCGSGGVGATGGCGSSAAGCGGSGGGGGGGCGGGGGGGGCGGGGGG